MMSVAGSTRNLTGSSTTTSLVVVHDEAHLVQEQENLAGIQLKRGLSKARMQTQGVQLVDGEVRAGLGSSGFGNKQVS